MLDAELSARVLRLVNVMDSGLHRQVLHLLDTSNFIKST